MIMKYYFEYIIINLIEKSIVVHLCDDRNCILHENHH